jgi:hypothetical protein
LKKRGELFEFAEIARHPPVPKRGAVDPPDG